MPYYMLKDKTYEIMPNIETASPALTHKQLKEMANVLAEHLGCFILFGMSLQGEPQVLMAASSGMEHLALKKFAEDVITGEANANFSPLEDDDK